MAKALLQKAKNDAIEAAQAARRNSQDKGPVMGSTPPLLPPPMVASAPVPVPRSKHAVTSSPVQTPTQSPVIQQVFIHTDNNALAQEKAARLKLEGLYEAEKAARARLQQQHQEEVERIKQAMKEQVEAEHQAHLRAEQLRQQELERSKQLVKDDDSLKRRHKIVLEKTKVDEEAIQRITQEKERLVQENETLRQELEKLKKAHEEAMLPIKVPEKEEENKKENVPPVPPPYDDADKPEPLEVAANNNDVPLMGEVVPASPVDDGTNDKCVVS